MRTPHLLTALSTLTSLAATAAEHPNILFILSDDAGYADFGFQGSKQFETPHLDALAQRGVVLRQMYTTDAVSGPSRAGLMTGRYQQRFGIEENNVPGLMSKNSLHTLADMGVSTDERFISNYLQEAGYSTAAFGKWHLGATDIYHPLRRGYDHFVGFRSGARSFYEYKDKKQLEGIGEERRLEYGYAQFREPDRYLTQLLADEACNWMEENSENPFFIYLAFNAVHSPLDVDPVAMKRFSHLKGKRQRLAAMTWSLDEACGKLLDKLEELGIAENTIVIFTNDNGGPNVTDTSNFPLSGCKATFLEGGIRVPAIISYPKVIEEGTTYNYPTSFLDFLPTLTTLAECEPDTTVLHDGVDLMPFLTGKNSARPHQTLYWKAENRGVVRDGDWKFMRFPDRPAELYDIATDEGEHHNLASQHPELVKRYYQMLFDWEMTLERPKWMLDRFCEERVVKEYYSDPKYRNPKEER